MSLTHNQVYTAFGRCRQIYGATEIHVQLLAKQLGVLASEILSHIEMYPTLFTTRMNTANSGYENSLLGNEYPGLIIKNISAIPFVTYSTVIKESDNGGTITLTPIGDTFKNLTSTANWTIDVGTTGLTFASVNSGTTTKVLTFTGIAQPGTISILCKAAGMTLGVATETIYVDIPNAAVDYTTLLSVANRLTALETLVGAEGGADDIVDKIIALEEAVSDLNSISPESGDVDAAVAANEILVLGALPTDGDTVTIGTITYTLVDALSEPAEANEVLIGVSAETCIDNLVTAITVGASGVVVSTGTLAHALVTAVKKDGDEMTVTAKTKGDAGNDIVLDSDFDSGSNLWTASAEALSGGIDGTVAEAGKILYGASSIWIATAECTISNSDGWVEIDYNS